MGTREDGSSAPCIVREVKVPQRSRENGAASDATAGGKGDGADSGSEEEGEQGPIDPSSILYVVDWLAAAGGAPTGERASLPLARLQRPAQGSRLATLTKPLLRRWVETVATAEPVAVRRARMEEAHKQAPPFASNVAGPSHSAAGPHLVRQGRTR